MRRSYDAVVSEWEWDPDTYLAEMADEIPGYEELQEAVAAATAGIRATRVLELGTGTGETALRVRAAIPRPAGSASTRASRCSRGRASGSRTPTCGCSDSRTSSRRGRSTSSSRSLAVHHLDGAGKRELFSRVARVLRPGGDFVLGDVVVPAAGEEGPIYIDWEMDKPDSVEDQLAWLREAGFEAEASSASGSTSPCSALGSAARGAPRAPGRAGLRRQRLRAARPDALDGRAHAGGDGDRVGRAEHGGVGEAAHAHLRGRRARARLRAAHARRRRRGRSTSAAAGCTTTSTSRSSSTGRRPRRGRSTRRRRRRRTASSSGAASAPRAGASSTSPTSRSTAARSRARASPTSCSRSSTAAATCGCATSSPRSSPTSTA